MRTVVAGMGVQGAKRKRVAGADIVATVDPIANLVDGKDIRDIPLTDYDAALLCVPDEPKIEIINYLLTNAKHVLVEKPLISTSHDALKQLAALAAQKKVVCYTAYNHRFEPHFVRMKRVIESGVLGNIYSIRMFYGNGTARLVRDSAWRDAGAGVLPDLGSHLLDTLRFWLGDSFDADFKITGAFRHENRSFDHVMVASESGPVIQLEMTLLSWRNHFSCDVFAENGSAHISSLCKWGPSTFTHRTRVLPSGRPPEDSETLVCDDPTWALEYGAFKELCRTGTGRGLETDIWINAQLHKLARQAGIASV